MKYIHRKLVLQMESEEMICSVNQGFQSYDFCDSGSIDCCILKVS